MRLVPSAGILAAGLLAGCAAPVEPPGPVRLVDRFRPEHVKGTPAAPGADEPIVWDFSLPPSGDAEPRATHGWEAVEGVRDLRVRNGRLTGTTTSDAPILVARRSLGSGEADDLHAVEVRLRVSRGANLSVNGGSADRPLESVLGFAKAFPWTTTSPVVAGDEVQTLTLKPQRPTPMSRHQVLLLRPTDAAGATFEIESVRLISQAEHLASVPSGVGWRGMDNVYRETLVTRAPERIRMELDLPDSPWLELHLGTLEEGPVTFQVHLSAAGEDPRLVLRRTVTMPHRWEPAPVDLTPFAGRNVTVSLSLDVPHEGTLGLWGTPVVRTRPYGRVSGIGPRAGDPPQGVILILADTLRKDHLEIYGHHRETAPFLAGLARRGALFEDAVAQATWTKVSTPSILTSLYPASHRVHDFPDQLPAAATTLAEVYRDAGYATVAYSSVLFTGKFTNLHQGFEELHESGSVDDPNHPSKTARAYVDRLCAWIEDHQDEPFFALLHVFDPHDPYEPRRPFASVWADPAAREAHHADLEKVRPFIQDPLMKLFGMPNREELQRAGLDPEAYVEHDRDWYDGSILALDAELARLVERLRHLGVLDRTVIAFTSDHGEEFLDHDRMFHGQSVYGELAGVPLVLYAPGRIPEGVRVSETVRGIDLMPTLLELSRLDAPEGIQGQSLVPLLGAPASGSAGEAAASEGWLREPAFIEKALTRSNASPPPHDTESYAVVFEGWKLVHHVRRPDGSPEFELFDHDADPLDQEDLAPEHPEVVKRLASMIAEWRRSTEAAALPEAGATEGLSADELERLRSLGYIQ